jgi:peptidoglycan/xylan/chitin deacetylase (PgdA/CDA1 family)
MSATVCIIWDYDAAIGQVNASYPYNFHEENLLHEIENVERILEHGRKYKTPMTFAVTGFAAEEGHFPYHVPQQIRRIYEDGHEIASHSWRHEWFPYLTREQAVRSLRRSKMALEKCIGIQGKVTGFVPPFSRPMSWYSRGAVSLGDRVFGPWYPGASLGSLLALVEEAGYRWCRVTYRPLVNRILRSGQEPRRFQRHGGLWCVPQHTTGFGSKAIALLRALHGTGGTLVVTGHPLGLSLPHEENLRKLVEFLERVSEMREDGAVAISTVEDVVRRLESGDGN